MTHLKQDYSSAASQHRPEQIKAIFKVPIPQEISEIAQKELLPAARSGKIYLVGRKAIDLIAKYIGLVLSRTRTQDFDFLLLTESMATFTETSFSTFILNKKLSNSTMRAYYRDTRSMPGTTPCDLIVKETSLKEHAESLDIILSSFAILLNGEPEEIGSVFDPLGKALQDLREKRIGIIGDPEVCFKVNPVALLRTIKYLARVNDVKAELALVQALHKFHPENALCDDHFLVVLKQLLESPESEKIVTQMIKYNLVHKLALYKNISPRDNRKQIAIKILTALYLRDYEKEINQYKLNTGTLLADEEILRGAVYERHLSEKHLAKLRTRELSLVAQSTHANEAISCNDKHMTALKEELKEATQQLNALNILKSDLMKYTEQEIELRQLERSHEALAVDSSGNIQIDALKRQYCVLQGLQEKELSDIRQKRQSIEGANKIKAAELECIQQTYAETVSYHDARLNAANAEIKRLQQIREKKRAERACKHVEKISPVTSAEAITVAGTGHWSDAVERDLSIYTLDQLKDMFSKMNTSALYCGIAYQLGMDAEEEENYIQAGYFYLRVLARQPHNQKVRDRFYQIQLHRPDINWSQKSPEYWCKIASEVDKTSHPDEVLLYCTLAIGCDSTYINAYIKRMNYFYKRDEVLAFVEDYAVILKLILDQKKKILDRISGLLPTEREERETLSKTLAGLEQTSSSMGKLLTKITQRTTPPTLSHTTVSETEKAQQLWNSIYIFSLLPINKIDYIKTCKDAYEKIIALDNKKTIEYAYAHYELSRCYEDLGNHELAHDHAMEASFVLPSIAVMERGCLADVDKYLKEKYPKMTFKISDGYKARNCYFLALRCLDLIIERYAHMTEAYWNKINLCWAIGRQDLIDERQVDQLISIYKQEWKSTDAVITARMLIELYLIKGDYSLARMVYMTISARKLSSCRKDLYSELLGDYLSVEMIAQMRNMNKAYFMALSLNARSMERLENKFYVYRMLSKILRDEGHYVEASRSLSVALNIELSSSSTYAYEQAQQEFFQLLSATQVADSGTPASRSRNCFFTKPVIEATVPDPGSSPSETQKTESSLACGVMR